MNLCNKKLTYSWVVTLIGIYEEQDIAAVIDTVVQDTVVDEIWKSTAHSDTDGFVSTLNITSIDLEEQLLTRLDSSKSGVTVTEVVDCLTSLAKPESCYEGTVELIRVSELGDVTEIVKAAVDHTRCVYSYNT